MRVLVDADACPVREIIVRLCREKHIPLVMVTVWLPAFHCTFTAGSSSFAMDARAT